MIQISSFTVTAVILVVLATMIALMNVDTANAFSIPSLASSTSTSKRNKPLFSATQDNDLTTSRANFLKRTTVAASAVSFWTLSCLLPAAASAKGDPSLKGTKADPEYEACMSTCIYECTKPKGVAQKSRKECIPECKQTCATSKAQLMIGTPIKKNTISE